MNTKLLKGARMRRRVRRAQRQLRRVLAECHVAHRCECERVTTRARLYLVTRWFARWRDGEATWDEAPPFVCRGQSD